MNRKRPLPMASLQSALGLPTIMDRALAAEYGARYVHLAAFAIDVDRVYWLDPEHPALPFGWEVFLTEYFMLATCAPPTAADQELLEVICMPLLEETPGEPPLGGQLVFAVYDAVVRGALPGELTTLFHRWRNPPRELVGELGALHADALATAERLADYCLAVDLEPKLSPLTRSALESIRSGGLLQPELPPRE
jgi:hypothetical protein